MKKFYLTDYARRMAIENILKQIDSIMSLKQGEMDYIMAREIVANLNDLADAIYNEVEDKKAVKRTRD